MKKNLKNMNSDDRNVEDPTGIPDSVQLYFREVGRLPLLTADEERELSLQVRAGHDAEELLRAMKESGAVTDLAQAAVYQSLVEQGGKAQDRLVRCNLRLVVAVAKKYQGRGLDMMDLIQEGNLGLMKAAERFESGHGAGFATFAGWWIRQGVSRAVADQSRIIRLPSHVFHDVSKLRRAETELTRELDRRPTVEELARHMGVSEKKVRSLQRVNCDAGSLDAPVGDSEDSATVGDLLSGGTEADEVNEAMYREQLKEALALALTHLDERERTILVLRYGLSGKAPCTLEEVGRQIGLTRERVRQLERKALKSLRGAVPELRSFLG